MELTTSELQTLKLMTSKAGDEASEEIRDHLRKLWSKLDAEYVRRLKDARLERESVQASTCAFEKEPNLPPGWSRRHDGWVANRDDYVRVIDDDFEFILNEHKPNQTRTLIPIQIIDEARRRAISATPGAAGLSADEGDVSHPVAPASASLELVLLSDLITMVKRDVLCSKSSEKLSDKSSQFWSLSINDLDSAISHLKLAAYCLVDHLEDQ